MQTPDLDKVFEGFSGMPVAVVGDFMLDTYVWGQVDRISPEAPVPVVRVQKTDHRIGGAGNVALNMAALGAGVHLMGMLGRDDEGDRLLDMLSAKGIHTRHLLQSDFRRTTSKTRVMGRHQQMLRLDREQTEELESVDEERLASAFDQCMESHSPRILVFEDYDKGVLTPRFVSHALSVCRARGILTAVDPKRRNFFAYRGVDIFKPNLKEVRDALGLVGDDGADADALTAMHRSLSDRLHHRISLITLSERGIFHASGNDSGIIPSHRRDISDVSGAGDTVVAVAAMAYAVTADVSLAAGMANIAGGLVCEEVGTAVVDRDRLRSECRLLLT